MKAPVVIIGIGELGGEFARGFLRCGHPVIPVTRKTSLQACAEEVPDPALVLVTVPEHELDNILAPLPPVWREKLCLLQNELLPAHWQRHHIEMPTVAVVWFEKKPEMALTNILYTPVFGPNAELVIDALNAIHIPSERLTDPHDLLYELTRKSLYILTVNICGLVHNVPVIELWEQHQPLTKSIARETIQILEWLCGESLPAEKLVNGMREGIEDCPGRYCLGRSAPERLARALFYADQAQLDVPKMREIQHLATEKQAY